ncbi:hypothetical protein PGT21_022688 [Puccinia graminis f. sp. tritici]|uniref:Uncharacterized protein n=1 Tax=Puccinia graminis f. sp. tritici TaxID=56615 RepID=A0A5B0QXV5_PUCGR|nr:hypothetical protein PGT21_022688 [Puccinia graminis f. sp. tritici]
MRVFICLLVVTIPAVKAASYQRIFGSLRTEKVERSDTKLRALANKPANDELLAGKGNISEVTGKGIMCPVRRSHMLKNWDKNQKEVILLDEYSRRLLKSQNKLLSEDFEFLESETREIDLGKLSEAREILEESKKNVSILKQWKLFKLAHVDFKVSHTRFKEWFISNEKDSSLYQQLSRSPVDLFGLIYDKNLEGLGNETLKGVKKLISHYDFLWNTAIPGYAYIFIKIRKHIRNYFCLIVDFLFENEMINQEIVRNLFQEEKIVREIVRHTTACLGKDIQMKQIDFGPSLTEHWYWPHVNKFFSALTEKEKCIFDFVFLVERVYHEGEVNKFSTIQFWLDGFKLKEIISKHYSIEQYFSRLKKFQELDDVDYFGGNFTLDPKLSTNKPKGDEEDMLKMIPLVLLQEYPQALSGYNKSYLAQLRPAVFDLLVFLEKNLCPGILNKFIRTCKLEKISLVVSTSQKYDTEDVVKLIILSSKCYNLLLLARDYEGTFKKSSERNVFGLSYDQSIPNRYLSQLNNILPEWKNIYYKVKEGGDEIITSLSEGDKNIPPLILHIQEEYKSDAQNSF